MALYTADFPKRILSMKSWLFNRDPGILTMAFEMGRIPSPIYPKQQPGFVHCSCESMWLNLFPNAGFYDGKFSSHGICNP